MSAPRIGEDFNFDKLKYKIPSSFHKPVLSDRSTKKGDKKSSKVRDSKKDSGSLAPPKITSKGSNGGAATPKKAFDRKASDIDQENPMLSKADITMPVIKGVEVPDESTSPAVKRTNKDRNTQDKNFVSFNQGNFQV